MRFLGVVQYVLVAAATVFTLRQFGLLDTSGPLFRLIVAFVAVACVSSVVLRRMSRRGRERRS
jgi:hypothetical protein